MYQSKLRVIAAADTAPGGGLDDAPARRLAATAAHADASADDDALRTLHRLRLAARWVALAIALLIPGVQMLFATQALHARLAVEAAQLADVLSQRASREPDTWLYRLNGLRADLAGVQQRNTVQAIRLDDLQARTVSAVGEWETPLAIERSADVFDSGAPVARVTLRASIALLLRTALQVALGSALIGLAVWWLTARLAVGSAAAAMQRLRAVREEAEAANRAKSAFLAAMSHEIRTPMNGVLGMAELLSHTPLSAEQAHSVSTMRHSAQSLLRIIDDILDFSKIEAGRLELEIEPLELTPLVEGVCEALAPVAAAREVTLMACVEPGVPERVLGDPVRLRQVLNNLVGNAVKFSAGRPARRGRVEVRAFAAAGEVAFAVADNGIGIEPDNLARLFQPFTQAEVSTTRRFGGTGLGLAICRRLVQLMGGRIEVQSTVGEGSRFEVRLPLAATGEQPSPPPAIDLSGVHCVLAPDAGLPRADLRLWLQQAGARVHELPEAASARGTHPLPALLRSLPAPVVVVRDAAAHEPAQQRTPAPAPALQARAASIEVDEAAVDAAERLGDVRWLLLGHGRRDAARVVSPTTATLDLLRRQPFLRAVAMMAGRASPPAAAPALGDAWLRDAPPPPTVIEAQAAGRLILVAEDDAVNRAVIARQLALLGHAAEMAPDGQQALTMWMSGRYALLLTDLHMPGRDGYALAEAVRATENAGGLPRRPIVALTANALKGEAARARAAGIDDYLTKPVPLKLLQAALAQWLPHPLPVAPATRVAAATHGAAAPNTAAAAAAQALSGAAASAQATTAAGTLDLRVLRGLVGDDEPLVLELLGDFAAQCGDEGERLVQAILGGDKPAVMRLAHKLKSAARSVGARHLGELCAALERSPPHAGSQAAQAQAEALHRLRRATLAAAHAHLRPASGELVAGTPADTAADAATDAATDTAADAAADPALDNAAAVHCPAMRAAAP